jgi:hypothetical protein
MEEKSNAETLRTQRLRRESEGEAEQLERRAVGKERSFPTGSEPSVDSLPLDCARDKRSLPGKAGAGRMTRVRPRSPQVLVG